MLSIVTKIARCVVGENSPTSRIMENDVHEYSGKHEAQEKRIQHLQKLTAQTDCDSLIITRAALSIPIGVYELTISHCGKISKERFQRSSQSKDDPSGSNTFPVYQ
ncbi:hypothetical protein AVEN_39251-1 [Araneus ventricosus]|uniref:Uncharacterized protein n=1 Tax=Araneus ventricosus TaxID=182803 RepID=A0A4Y2ESI1_ARAVE|nr:hypothetical protein AVEN_39251-1 [Araneus ventricosus]